MFRISMCTRERVHDGFFKVVPLKELSLTPRVHAVVALPFSLKSSVRLVSIVRGEAGIDSPG